MKLDTFMSEIRSQRTRLGENPLPLIGIKSIGDIEDWERDDVLQELTALEIRAEAEFDTFSMLPSQQAELRQLASRLEGFLGKDKTKELLGKKIADMSEAEVKKNKKRLLPHLDEMREEKKRLDAIEWERTAKEREEQKRLAAIARKEQKRLDAIEWDRLDREAQKRTAKEREEQKRLDKEERERFQKREQERLKREDIQRKEQKRIAAKRKEQEAQAHLDKLKTPEVRARLTEANDFMRMLNSLRREQRHTQILFSEVYTRYGEFLANIIDEDKYKNLLIIASLRPLPSEVMEQALKDYKDRSIGKICGIIPWNKTSERYKEKGLAYRYATSSNAPDIYAEFSKLSPKEQLAKLNEAVSIHGLTEGDDDYSICA